MGRLITRFRSTTGRIIGVNLVKVMLAERSVVPLVATLRRAVDVSLLLATHAMPSLV